MRAGPVSLAGTPNSPVPAMQTRRRSKSTYALPHPLETARRQNTLTAPDEQDKTIQLTLLISRAELMLDPNIESHRTLMQNLDRVRHTAFEGNKQLDQFPDTVEQLKKQGRIVLQELT
jgi:hypothetical protein